MPEKMRLLSAYDKFLAVICKISIFVTGVSLVVMTAIFGWLVYGRYVLNATPTWVEQVSLLLVVGIGFIGASVGVHQRTHLNVSYFRDVSPRPLRRFFELLTHIIMSVFALIMMVKSYELMMFKWGSQIPLLDIPEGVRAIPIMLCGAFVLLYSIGHIIHFFQGEEEHSNLLDLTD